MLMRNVHDHGGNNNVVMKRAVNQSKNDRIVKEARILKKFINSPNIVKFLDVFPDESNRMCLVIEWCPGGDLQKWIDTQETDVRSANAREIFIQLASALDTLHSSQVVHRDLKPANIFISSSSSLTGLINCKLGDFSASFDQDQDEALKQENMLAETNAIGTPQYMSPEIVKGFRYTEKCDVWALGCVMYEVAKGKPLYNNLCLRDLLQAILRLDPPRLDTECEPAVSEMIKQCLQKDPKDRPTCSEIIRALQKPKMTRDECIRILNDHFGNQRAQLMIEALTGASSPPVSAYQQALAMKPQTIHEMSSEQILKRVIKLRRELVHLISMDDLEKAVANIKLNLPESEYSRMVPSYHLLKENNLFDKIKELSLLEEQLYN